MMNLRPGSGLIAGPTFGEVQTDAGSLCLKEPDHDYHDGNCRDGHGDDDHNDKIPWPIDHKGR